MGDLVPGGPVAPAGRVVTGGMTEERLAPRFVMGQPRRDPIAEAVEHDPGVVDEGPDGLAVAPAARRLEGERQVPVIQGRDRSDPGRQELVDQTIVEVEAALVDRAPTRRDDPRPGDGEPIRADAESTA